MTDTIKDFLLQDLSVLEETKEINLDQFSKPIVIRALTTSEFDAINKEATMTTRNKKTGQSFKETNDERLNELVLINGIVTPDLTNETLQAHYGVNNAGDAARKILKAGQFYSLAQDILEMSGFNLDQLVTEVKK